MEATSTRRSAIPTMRNGIQFRSRLEAKWAGMFDAFGWRWEYEPFDLNGWIPDFMLLGGTPPVLVEVKPCSDYPADVALKCLRAMQGTHAEGYEVMITGATLPVEEYGQIGWFVGTGWDPPLSQCCEPGVVRGDAETTAHYHADATVMGRADGSFALLSTQGLWGSRIGDGHYKTCRQIYSDELQAIWRRVGNEVQWKSPAR